MTSKVLKTAMALSIAGAVALPASQAAAGTSKTESALLGALVGGVAGAAAGNGHRDAIAVGALAGAALGVTVDAANDRKARPRYVYRDSRPYYRDSRYRSYDRYYDGYRRDRYARDGYRDYRR